MRRHLQLFLHYFAQYAKVRVAYRGDFFIAVTTSLAATILAFGFLIVLFTRIPRLQDWRFEEVLFIYGFSLVPLGLFNVLSLNLYQFGDQYIIQGKFDRILLRPVHSLFQVIFEVFRIESLHEVATGLIVVAYCSKKLGLHWSAVNIGLFLLMSICGAVIYLSIFLLLTSVSFWFEDRIGVVPPVYNMIAFGRYPLSIYNTFIQFLLTWIVPFAFASFYPSVHFLNREEFRRLFYFVPVVATIFFSLALFVWHRGELHYSSTGS